MLEKFITQKDHYDIISDAVLSVTGKELKVQIYNENIFKFSETKPVQNTDTSLDSILKRAKELNIEIINKGAKQ